MPDEPDLSLPRCRWATTAPEFPRYHDEEWGWPIDDDRRLFEKLSLEAFQSGLSWRTILVKRPRSGPRSRTSRSRRSPRSTAPTWSGSWSTAGIVRHRGKIEAVINNAARALETDRGRGIARGVRVALRARSRLAAGPTGGLHLPRVGGALQGAEATRLEVRRPDDGVRVHAGLRDGERPPGSTASCALRSLRPARPSRGHADAARARPSPPACRGRPGVVPGRPRARSTVRRRAPAPSAPRARPWSDRSRCRTARPSP